MKKFIFTFILTLFLGSYAYAAQSDGCGCMTKTHDAIKSAYLNIEQENDLIREETDNILKDSAAPAEIKTEATQEQAEIGREKDIMKKHLELIKKGMDDSAHMVLMEEYNELLKQHAGLLDKHNKLYTKFKK